MFWNQFGNFIDLDPDPDSSNFVDPNPNTIDRIHITGIIDKKKVFQAFVLNILLSGRIPDIRSEKKSLVTMAAVFLKGDFLPGDLLLHFPPGI